MAVQSQFYPVDGTTKVFVSSKHIATKGHAAAWKRNATTLLWSVAAVSEWDLINNSVVFRFAPAVIDYDIIEVRVADTQDELGDSPAATTLISSFLDEIKIVADNIDAVIEAAGKADKAAITVFEFTTTGDTTEFTFDYDTTSKVFVLVNGIQLMSDEYTAASGTSVILSSSVPTGIDVKFIVLGSFFLADTYLKAEIDAKLALKADTTALAGYVPTSRTVNGKALTSDVTLAKADIGLGNVDNTPDASKPVSTPQQTALDLKQNVIGVLHVLDGTGGASVAGTWVARALDVVVKNTITGASVDTVANTFTLPAGTYDILAHCNSSRCRGNVARLYNVTGAEAQIGVYGTSSYSGDGSVNSHVSTVYGRFTIASESVFRIEHNSQYSHSVGLGAGHGIAGIQEAFMSLQVYKVG